jgi:hypothetical protein
MSETACGFIWIEAAGKLVLVLREKHLRLAFEDEELVLVERFMDDFKVGVG